MSKVVHQIIDTALSQGFLIRRISNRFVNFFSLTVEWEILDSFFGLATNIVRHRLEEIPFDLLLNFVRKNIENSNSFIRVASVELLFELLSGTDEKCRKTFDAESFIENLFLFETEAIVRRTCSKMMIKFDGDGKSSNIRRIMLRGLRDLDWEVKEQVRMKKIYFVSYAL